MTKTQIKTLMARRASYLAELQTCTTDAMRRCVLEQIEGVCSQLIAGGALLPKD